MEEINQPVVPIHINGKDIVTGTTFPVTDPGSASVIYEASSVSPDDVHASIQAATAALPAWAASKPGTRRDIFLRAADALERQKDRLAYYMQQETGATKTTGYGNVHIAAGLIRDIAGRITECLSGFVPVCANKGSSAIVVKEPYGVILAIAPWNAPYILGVRSVVYALAAGNTVVLKGSELSPRCMWAISQVFKEAGLNDGCLNVIYSRRQDSPEITNLLVAHPAIKKINFTGSTAVGSIIASLAGKFVKPCLMELGGKASAIVLDDADLQKAASGCAAAAFSHAGQICMSTERIIVQSSVFAPFISALKQSTADFLPDSSMAPIMIQASSLEKTRNLVADALSKGAETIYGNLDDKEEVHGHRLRPIIISLVTKDMSIYDTETFGPVVCIFKVDSEDQAVELANDTEYGLSGSIFTENLGRGLRIAKRVASGAIHINSSSIHNEPTLPHGGVKDSGWGRFNADWGIDEFLQIKTITFEGDI